MFGLFLKDDVAIQLLAGFVVFSQKRVVDGSKLLGIAVSAGSFMEMYQAVGFHD